MPLVPAERVWKLSPGGAAAAAQRARSSGSDSSHGRMARAPRVSLFSSLLPSGPAQPAVRLMSHTAWLESGANCSARETNAMLETAVRGGLTAEEALVEQERTYERNRLRMSREQLFSMLQVFAFTRTADEIQATQALELISGGTAGRARPLLTESAAQIPS